MIAYPYTQADETAKLDAEANSIGEATREAETWGDICPDCEGSGEVADDYFSDDGMRTCPRCGGMGTV